MIEIQDSDLPEIRPPAKGSDLITIDTALYVLDAARADWHSNLRERRILALEDQIGDLLTRQVSAYNQDPDGILAAERMEQDIRALRNRIRSLKAQPEDDPLICDSCHRNLHPDEVKNKGRRRRKYDGWTA